MDDLKDKSLRELKAEMNTLKQKMADLEKEEVKDSDFFDAKRKMDVFSSSLIQELNTKELCEIRTKEELISFLKEYPKEKYNQDILPIIQDVLESGAQVQKPEDK